MQEDNFIDISRDCQGDFQEKAVKYIETQSKHECTFIEEKNLPKTIKHASLGTIVIQMNNQKSSFSWVF